MQTKTTMISTKTTFLIAALLLVTTFFSCNKVEESIKRDVIITPDSTAFEIPAISNTNTGQVAGLFSVSLDLNAEIKKIADEFGESNVRDIRLTALRLNVKDTVADNNLGNIEYIKVKMISGAQEITVADYQSNPATKSIGINIPVLSPITGLREILNAESFKYDIRVKLRKPTTAILKANIRATYTVSLGF